MGLAARGATDPSLYACRVDVVLTTDCGRPHATCEAVADSGGLEVRDIELGPSNRGDFFVADATYDAVFEGDISDDGYTVSGGLDALPVSPDALVVGPTGIAFDNDGDYLFIFAGEPRGTGYAGDRIYRIETGSIGDTEAWQAVNTDSDDEEIREGNLDGLDAWFTGQASSADQQVRVNPFPGRDAPGRVIDGVFVPHGQDEEVAYVGNISFFWRVEGLDEPWVVLDAADPAAEINTFWTFAPDPSTSEDRTWQTTTIYDVAVESSGRVWISAGDWGLFMRPEPTAAVPEPYTQLDCLWQGVKSAQGHVTVAPDGSIWATLRSEAGSPPQDFGVYRYADMWLGNWLWMYEGAGYTDGDFGTRVTTEDPRGPTCPRILQGAGCKDEIEDDDTSQRLVEAMGASSGKAFNYLEDSEITQPSWGNPGDIQALDQKTAVVVFNEVDWEWIQVTHGLGTTDCRVDATYMGGVVLNPAPPTDSAGNALEQVFIWGLWKQWTNTTYGTEHTAGGVCSLTRDPSATPTYTTGLVVDPLDHPFDIGDVAPHPSWQPTLLLVGQSASFNSQLRVVDGVSDATLDRPSAWPLLVEQVGGGWAVDPLDDEVLPNFAVSSVAWGTLDWQPGEDVPGTYMFLGTGGNGVWYGRYESQ